jgi:hypothetical protein
MITSTDILHLPYTPDLTEGGIAYACRSLATTSERMGGGRPRAGTGTNVERLRHIVGGVAVELAFRHTLNEQAIPFNVLGATPFTHPNRYNVSLGGHRCDLKSFLITRRQQIALIRKDPALVLQAPALLPLDQFAAEGHKLGDVYLFAFLLGVVAAAREDVDKAVTAGQPTYLIHPLPDNWARPADWPRAGTGTTSLPLEKLVLKSECETPISIEIGGQNVEREFVTATLELPPKKRVPVEQSFHSLAYVHTARRPEARIGLHSPLRGEAYIIPAHAWGNIWVYGMDILFTGWLSHEEYRRKAKVLNAGMHTFQYDRTRVKNLLVPMVELNPLGGLLTRVKEWEAERGSPAHLGAIKSSR